MVALCCILMMLDRLEQSGSALAATDAHSHNAVLLVATLEFTQD
jgi:hypothetical protein